MLGLIMGDAVAESGGASGGSSEVGSAAGGRMEESERIGGGGNRWPRQETLALLKIRSDMDVAFRDASLKGPLWEEVSRKMADGGFQRSGKKCKEKFENVYKYHKRTKDGRAAKPDGKSYRFFNQLAALENTPPPPPAIMAPPPLNAANIAMPASHVTVSSSSPTPLSVVPPKTVTNALNSSSFQPSQPPLIQPPVNASAPPPPPQSHNFQPSHRPVSTSLVSNSTSSSTSSDEDIQRRRGRKRKWKDYFERLMKDVIQKQEELQKKFLETLEKSERDRIGREEGWRVQEMARMNREHDRIVQERSIAAAKDAAVVAFLQKVTGEQNLQVPLINNNATQQMPMQVQAPPQNSQPVPQLQPPPPPPPPPQPQQHTLPPPAEPPTAQPIVMATPTKMMEISNRDNGSDDVISASSSRWPKAEVEVLIKLRTGLEVKYQDNGPKGPLWEEISKSMAKLGYNRNAKRCKEKWENINKYYKKVKESNKKRPEDAKTCPYFHQLEAIYKERAKNNHLSFNLGYTMKPESPIMARPEQQWPLPEQHPQNPGLHERDHHNDSQNDDHDDDEDEDDEDEVGEYEIITNNKLPSSLTNTVE